MSAAKTKSKSKTPTKKPKSKKKKKVNKWVSSLIIALVVALLAACAYYLLSGQKGHSGIDVSHYQGNIDWETIATETDVEFAFIKATEGATMTDEKFQRNRRLARKNGILTGAYHFMLPNLSGKVQFDHFADVVGNDIDLKPVLDLENPKKGTVEDDAAYAREVKVWISACEKEYGCKPIIYASTSFIRDHKLQDAIALCPYWMAWYTFMPNIVTSRRNYLMLTHPGTQAIVWQYTDKGTIEGIDGKVDLDECWEMSSIKL